MLNKFQARFDHPKVTPKNWIFSWKTKKKILDFRFDHPSKYPPPPRLETSHGELWHCDSDQNFKKKPHADGLLETETWNIIMPSKWGIVSI